MLKIKELFTKILGELIDIHDTFVAKTVKVDKGAVGLGGLRTTDSTDYEYPLIKDNGTNLWIGAEQSASQHHRGRTYISTGYNGTSGNESLYVSVPNENNDGGTTYQVLHTGNYPKYLDYNAGETVTLSLIVGTGYSTGTSGTYYLFLDTPKQVPSGKTLTVTSITATIRGVNGVVVSNADVLSNISNMLRASNGKPRILLTGLTNNFKANTPAHIVCTVTFTIEN